MQAVGVQPDAIMIDDGMRVLQRFRYLEACSPIRCIGAGKISLSFEKPLGGGPKLGWIDPKFIQIPRVWVRNGDARLSITPFFPILVKRAKTQRKP